MKLAKPLTRGIAVVNFAATATSVTDDLYHGRYKSAGARTTVWGIRYNRFAMVCVSDVNKVESVMLRQAYADYHIIGANCGTAVNDALKAGGVKVGYFITPNSQFSAITSRNVIHWYYER